MKHSVRNLLFGLSLLSTFNLQPSPCFAQGTALTYQGVLSQNGTAINGASDLTFTLYNAASGGGTVGASNVVNDLVTTNGLFTVTLDFGPGAFDGTARWLQIAVRPGVSTGAYTNLVPRQSITATPYAVYAASAATAGSASSVAASNITGTIDDGRLSANVARLNVGNTFSESQTIRTSAGGLVISSSTGGQFGSGTLRVQGNTGLGADPHPLYRLFVAGNMSASSYVGDGSQLANVEAETYLGPVADNQLSVNIARRTNGNTFAGNQVIANGNFGIGTATPSNLLDVAAGGVIGNSTVLGVNIHDTLNRETKVSFGYNLLGSEFNGMSAVVNPGTAGCGNSGDLLFHTWECNTGPSREVMRINGRGDVGIGTTSPSERLDVAGNIRASGNLSAGGYIRASGNVGIGQMNPGFPLNFANTLGDKIALFQNEAGQPSFGFGIQSSLLQIHTADAGSDVAFGYGTSAAMTETMRIKGNGNVGIGTTTPNSDSRLQVNGMVRMGSETGTSEAPNKSIMVRRINSTSSATNQVVARSLGGIMTLERDGTAGGLIIKVNGAYGGTPQMTGFGINSSGATVNVYHALFGGGGNTTTQIFTDAQKIGYCRIMFGDAFNAGDMTTVELMRLVDNVGNNTIKWVGTVTSTFNQ